MPSYDAGWGPFRGGGRPGNPGGGPPRGPGGFGGFGPAYGGDFRPHGGWGGAHVDRERMEDGGFLHGDLGGFADGGGGEGAGEGMYGPARYGLGPYHQRLRRRTRPDAELKEEVEEALFYDTWVDADAVTVEVRDGVVTLRGELPDYNEVRYATDDAWDVDGVRGVRSELTVRSAQRARQESYGLDRQPPASAAAGTPGDSGDETPRR